MNQQRKGQLSIFLILGILLLITTAIVLYLQGKILGEKTFKPVIDEVPLEFQPIKDYMDRCIEETSMEAITLLGLHGGYIGLEPGDALYTKTAFQTDPAGVNPTESDAVTFTEGSNWKIPYWYHLESKNGCTGNCEFASLQPPLYRKDGSNSIEAQLDVYIQEHLQECLQQFRDFEKQGFHVTEEGKLQVVSLIGKEQMNVYLTYPLAVQSEFGEIDIENFGISLDVDLDDLYNLAAAITTLQQQHRFLEANAMNLVAGFQGLDEEKLPPLAATDFSSKSLVWSEEAVKQKIQNQLAVYLQRLKMENTKNFQPYRFSNALKQGLHENFMIPNTQQYREEAVEFTYLPIWPIYLDVGEGQVSTSQGAMNTFFSWLPIKQYATPYDISYPVVVELSQPEAFQKRGYKFYFALEGNIRNNLPMDADFIPLRKANLGETGQFCNPNQRNSGEIEVEVKDSEGNAVEHAAIVFAARESCLLGNTALENARTIFRGKFPVGIGSLRVEHPDYFTAVVPFSTALDKEERVTVELQRIVEKEIRVMKKNLFKQNGWFVHPDPIPLKKNERALVILDRVKETPLEEDFTSVVEVRGTETATIQLVPGNYVVQVQIIAENTPVIIPEKKRCKRAGFKRECVTIPQTTVAEDDYFGGNMQLQWDLSSFQLYRNTVIRFHGLFLDLPGTPIQSRDIEDLQMLDQFDEIVQQKKAELLPRFETK